MSELTLDGVGKRYRRKAVLTEVTHRFRPGLTLLTGPSGAGKSTLLRLIATAEKPSAGRIAWDGAPLPSGRRALRTALGYAPQAVDLPEDLTAREFAMHIAALTASSVRSPTGSVCTPTSTTASRPFRAACGAG